MKYPSASVVLLFFCANYYYIWANFICFASFKTLFAKQQWCWLLWSCILLVGHNRILIGLDSKVNVNKLVQIFVWAILSSQGHMGGTCPYCPYVNLHPWNILERTTGLKRLGSLQTTKKAPKKILDPLLSNTSSVTSRMTMLSVGRSTSCFQTEISQSLDGLPLNFVCIFMDKYNMALVIPWLLKELVLVTIEWMQQFMLHLKLVRKAFLTFHLVPSSGVKIFLCPTLTFTAKMYLFVYLF